MFDFTTASLFISLILLFILDIIYAHLRRKMGAENINRIFYSPNEVSAENFLEFRKEMGYGKDLKGVFVLFDKTRDMNYVKQTKHMFKEVENYFFNFSGDNEFLIEDIKNGNEYFIKFFPFELSGYSKNEELELDLVRRYNASFA